MTSLHAFLSSQIFNPYYPSYFRWSSTKCICRVLISFSVHSIIANLVQWLAIRYYGNIDGSFHARHSSRLPDLCSVCGSAAIQKIARDQVSFDCTAACCWKEIPGRVDTTWRPWINPARFRERRRLVSSEGTGCSTIQLVGDVETWCGWWYRVPTGARGAWISSRNLNARAVAMISANPRSFHSSWHFPHLNIRLG